MTVPGTQKTTPKNSVSVTCMCAQREWVCAGALLVWMTVRVAGGIVSNKECWLCGQARQAWDLVTALLLPG